VCKNLSYNLLLNTYNNDTLKVLKSQHQWFTPEILAVWEAEIRRIAV
jgi:hypothetical protein